MDTGGRVLRARARRRELRARCDSIRAPPGRAGRDCGATAQLRRARAFRGYGLVVTLSPLLEALRTYPFVRLDQAKAAARERGIEVLDFGMGDPVDPTPAFIQRALADALPATAGYPRAPGLPELRTAVAAWVERRFEVDVDADRELIPTYGSKEAIFLFPLVACRPGKDLVLVPEPAYPVYERGAAFAGAEVRFVSLREKNGWLPDFDAIEEDDWERCAIFWSNYPHNPTGAVASRGYLEELAARAREHGFYFAADEAY